MTNDGSTDILFDVFAANISEVAEGTKSESHKLVIERIEFTQRGRMKAVSKQREFVLKGTGTGNQMAN